MAIDRTGISSLQTGAPDIKYTGDQGPRSPDQQLMASADPMLVEMYQQYVFEMEEQGMQPMSFRQFMQQAMSGMAQGGRAGFQGGGADYMPTDPGPMGNPAVVQEIEDAREFRIANPNIEDVTDYAGESALMRDANAMVEAGVVENRAEAIRLLLQKKMYGVRSEPGMAYGGTARPTYTQSRKQRMAYGGVAGLDGRRRYGIGSWFQEKVMDPIKKVIPNEIKNPATLAVLGGGALNQWGLPFDIGSLEKGAGENWLGNLINKDLVYGQGGEQSKVLSQLADTNLQNTALTKAVPAGAENLIYGTPQGTISNNPAWGGIESLAKNVGLGGASGRSSALQKIAGVIPDTSYTDRIMDIAKNRDLITNPTYGTFQDDRPLWKKTTDAVLDFGKRQLQEAFPGSGETKPDAQGRYPINWKGPLAIGTAAGLAQAAMPQAQLPTDTSGINIADIRRRALTGSDPDLHFLPQASATTAYAQGGRTGYQDAGEVQQDVFIAWDEYKSGGGEENFNDWFNDIYLSEAGQSGVRSPQDLMEIERKAEALVQAGVVENKADAMAILQRSYPEPSWTTPDRTYQAMSRSIDVPEGLFGEAMRRFPDQLRNQLQRQIPNWPAGREQFEDDLPYGAAQGGRIGYKHGGAHWYNPFSWFGGSTIRNKPELEKKVKESQKRQQEIFEEIQGQAQGGRIGAQEGGLMDLGGMEKDYRQEGGFVPIGGQERADDVPARLSKNEFVFTADAVRAAGGGDIDAGAEVMENLMNNLEQGGQVSEESQGLEGARDMFATAQRLEGVL